MKDILGTIIGFVDEHSDVLILAVLAIMLFALVTGDIVLISSKFDAAVKAAPEKLAEIDSLKEVIHKYENKQAVFIGRKDHILQEVSDYLKDPYNSGCCLIIK